ncbi:DUF4199 domain-containing protein [Fulvivirga sp. 29W222]|uniref:DUF4199 domain-containing protein n=1 Tax=Fulvivirga marina TaxID=2494733 RepID=A0A937G031_9BACT|nr:DUF4199 domain-containing protein [Fulvivirga marina]MBL6448032.1 DUF4199 domain-containing protein [Fulvivirga marina]
MEDSNSVLDHSQGGEQISVKQVATKYGLILGVISIALFLVTVFAGLIGNQAMQYVGYIPTIILIIYAHKEFKSEGDGFMSYGQGLGSGTLLVLIGTVISTVFFYVYVKFIDSSFMEIVREKQLEGMQEQGMSEEQIDQAMAMASGFMTPEFISVIAIFMTVFFGFILSLIISAFTKNSNPDLDM